MSRLRLPDSNDDVDVVEEMERLFAMPPPKTDKQRNAKESEIKIAMKAGYFVSPQPFLTVSCPDNDT